MKAHAYQNVPLCYDEAYALGQMALRGCKELTFFDRMFKKRKRLDQRLAQIQSIATLCALHSRATYSWQWNKHDASQHSHDLPQSAAEMIAGICASIFQEDIAKSESGFLRPAVDVVMDNCGMGGDLIVTANVSTIAALIAASAGIPMCKHGSPANADQGRHGSSDFVEMLGINTMAPRSVVEACVERHNFGYTEALDVRYKHIHLQTHKVAQLPHMNDLIGPITNPVDPSILRRRVLGVNHLVSPTVVAEAYKIMNERGVTKLERGVFVRGYVVQGEEHGMDELSLCPGGTAVARLEDGEVSSGHIWASDFGLSPVDPKSISPPAGMSKGEFSLRILERKETSEVTSMVLANAALLFQLHAGGSLKEAFGRAREAFEGNDVMAVVRAVAQATKA